MMESGIVIENNLDKECGALSGLFQQIITEMKSGIPNFDEFVNKAGKLHTTLKSTILVLGSFLDSFQKIADAASNTKGATRDIGTCLTRIVIRHRALESRMKTLAGAVMDCLVLPIQGKLEEWKKIALVLDKEHSKGFKKYRNQIKKKSDQALRLKKKLRKERGGVPDPSVQRLFDQCSKDLNSQFKSLEEIERRAVKKVLMEDRNRYCTLVAFLKPVIDEEFAMLAEIHQIEEIMSKLNKAASFDESADVFIEDFLTKGGNNPEESSVAMCLPTPAATPPSTPSPSMGSRNGSMSSLESGSTATNSSISIEVVGSPTRRSIQSSAELEALAGNYNKNEIIHGRPSSSMSHQKVPNYGSETGRPVSSTSWEGTGVHRPHTISTSFDRRHIRSPITGSTFVPPSIETMGTVTNDSEKLNNSNDYNFLTIKRTYSPFRRPSDTSTLVKRPPLPQRCSSAERSIPSTTSGRPRGFIRCTSIDRSVPISTTTDSNPHYAVPKASLKLQMVPNFHLDKKDMVIPQPVYMNCKEMKNIKISEYINSPSGGIEVSKTVSTIAEDDLKTPTVEELSFPGQKVGATTEDGSSSSSGSIGSSSGYGSQSTIKLDDIVNNGGSDGLSTPQHSFSPQTFQQQQPLQQSHHYFQESINPPLDTKVFFENRKVMSNIMTLNRRSLSLRRNEFYSKGCSSSPAHRPGIPLPIQRSISAGKPVPPLRRTPVNTNKQSDSPVKHNPNKTERRSEEAIDEDATPRGSVENLPPMVNVLSQPTTVLRRSTSMTGASVTTPVERDTVVRRSYHNCDKTSLFGALNAKLNQRLNQKSPSKKPEESSQVCPRQIVPLKGPRKNSDEEIYGFGQKFKNAHQDYFETNQDEANQVFIESLSAKLKAEDESRSRLNEQIKHGTFHLKATPDSPNGET